MQADGAKPGTRRSEMNYRILSMLMIVGALVVVLIIPVTVMAGGNAATASNVSRQIG